MITTCTECQARYQLDAERIPPRMIKVRCPSCGGVFSLDGSKAKNEETKTVEQPSGFSSGYGDFAPPPPEPTRTEAPAAQPVREPVVESAPEQTAAPAASVEVSPPAAEPATQVAVMDAPAEPSSRRRRSKEEMLARALVSDIMVYNRDLYDQAKAENNLLEALGSEIKKSWELYKDKVTPEVANSTNHFRDALNEILADGETIF